MTFTDFFIFDVGSNCLKSVHEKKKRKKKKKTKNNNLQASFELLISSFKYTEVLVFSFLIIV